MCIPPFKAAANEVQPPGFKFEVPTDFISLQVVPKNRKCTKHEASQPMFTPRVYIYRYMISIFQKIKKLHMYIYI